MQDDETALVELSTHVAHAGPAFLTSLGPLIIASKALNVAADSRSFAKLFDVAHAHVIREITHLQEDLEMVVITRQDDRSARMFFDLTKTAETLMNMDRIP